MVRRKKNVIRLNVAMNDSLTMGVGECLGNLLEPRHSIVEIEFAASTQRPQIPARHVLKHEVVKRHACEICRCAVTEPLDYVRVPNSIQRYRFVLKVLDQSLFKFGVRSSLKR